MRLARFMAVFVGVVLGSATFSACTTNPVQQHYQDGAKAETEGDYRRAVSAYKKALAVGDAKVLENSLYKLATIHELFLKDYAKAVYYYQELIARTTKTELLFQSMKQSAFMQMDQLRDHQSAIVSFTGLLNRFGNNAEADTFQYNLARCYLKVGQLSQARVELNKLLKNYPNTTYRIKAELELSKSFYMESDYPAAERSLSSFVKTFPQEPETAEAMFFLAHVFEEKDDLKRAVKLYEDLLQTHPDRHLIQLKLERLKKRVALRGR